MILTYAALLHDIGKPFCTASFEKEGLVRIGAKNHEDKGRSYLAHLLSEYPLSNDDLTMILNLVSEHHIPKLLVLKNSPIKDWYRLANLVDMELIYWLEMADMKGRICNDHDMNMLILDEFYQQCIAHDLFNFSWNRWLSGIDDDYTQQYARYWMLHGDIQHPLEAVQKAFSHKMNHRSVVMMCGLSGSGKSTYASKHYPDHTVISLDAIRQELAGSVCNQKMNGQVRQLAKERFKQALRSTNDIVLDATHLVRELRQQWIQLAISYHALVSIHVVLTPIEKTRHNDHSRVDTVGESIINRQQSQFDMPTANEAHRITMIR